MANAIKATSGIVGAQLTQQSVDPQFRLGQTALGDDGSEYVYVKASGAVGLNDLVGINQAFTAAKLTKALADAGVDVGVASQKAITDAYYFWAQRRGHCSVNVLASCAASAALYTTATAGSLDDTSSSQTKIDGIVLTTGVGGAPAAAPAILTYPKSTTF